MSSGVSDTFVRDLLAELCAATPRVGELRHATKRLLSASGDDSEIITLRYFTLYTVPLLDAGGFLLDPPSRPTEVAAAHLALGLHIRYSDYVVDGDRPAKVIGDSRSAMRNLLHAQALLGAAGEPWTDVQSAVLIQYLDYESEVAAGFRHDIASLWRRVSPLCVVGDTVLRWPQEPSATYRHFLAWSLMYADCDDFLQDMRAGRWTPVTRLISDHLSGTAADADAVAATIVSMRRYLEVETERLLTTMNAAGWLLWSRIVQRLSDIFRSHAS